jgi:hypothetical protein
MVLKKIVLWLTVLLLSSSEYSRVEAAGRTKPELEGSARSDASILVNSWYRDKMIQVALANIAHTAQRLKVAVGAEDSQSELYASQSLSIPARSILIVYFPVLKRKTLRGLFKEADSIYVYHADGSLIDSQTVQNMDASRMKLNPESFIAATGDGIVIRRDVENLPGLRLVFIPRSLRVQDNILIPGRQREGVSKTCTEEDLNNLELPDEYRLQARAMLSDHFGYMVKAGETVRISVYYPVPQIADCTLVRISDYEYFFSPDGSVRHGRGPVSLVMIYNPALINIVTPLPLVLEGSEAGSKQKMKYQGPQ